MELIIHKRKDDDCFPQIVIDPSGFTEIIVADAPQNKYESYGFPVRRPYLRRIYDWLVIYKYIEWLPWEHFLYFFEGRIRCPESISPIVWLKRSKEGIGILINEIYSPFRSKNRNRIVEQKKRIDKITEQIFIDNNNAPCHIYKRSSGGSRVDAQELELFLDSIRELAIN